MESEHFLSLFQLFDVIKYARKSLKSVIIGEICRTIEREHFLKCYLVEESRSQSGYRGLVHLRTQSSKIKSNQSMSNESIER